MSINISKPCWLDFDNRSIPSVNIETKSTEEYKFSDTEFDCFSCRQPLNPYKALVHSGTSDTTAKVHAYCLEKWVTLCISNRPWSTAPCPVCREPLKKSEEPIEPISSALTTHQRPLQEEDQLPPREENHDTDLRAHITNELENANPDARNGVLEHWASILLPCTQFNDFRGSLWDNINSDTSSFTHAAQLLAKIEGTADDLYHTVQRITLNIERPELEGPLVGAILRYLAVAVTSQDQANRYEALWERYNRDYLVPATTALERMSDSSDSSDDSYMPRF